jgi:hypothetical protein
LFLFGENARGVDTNRGQSVVNLVHYTSGSEELVRF